MRRRQQFLAEFCADRLELVRLRPIDPKPGIHWFSDDPALDPPVPDVLFKVMEAEDEQSLRRSHDLRALALVLRAHRDAMEQLFEDVIEGTPDPQERHVLQLCQSSNGPQKSMKELPPRWDAKWASFPAPSTTSLEKRFSSACLS